MVFKSFRSLVILRVVLLSGAIFLFVFLVGQSRHLITSIILGCVILFQIFDLIRFVERTNRKLTQFLESIRYSEFSASFSDQGLGKNFDQLGKAFNNVIQEFKNTRTDKEEHYNYLQTVVQHINIGIIAYRSDGKVDLYNNSVKRLFKLTHLKNIHDLEEIKKELPSLFLSMKPGDRQLVRLFIENELLQLSIYATGFKLRSEDLTLVSLQNISSELEEKEVESWQKLIRVLTHEIMNSITPISSLASTVKEMVFEISDEVPVMQSLDQEDSESVISALTTIQNRSQGLLNFVEIYRNLTRIPKPSFKYITVSELLGRCEQLLQPKLQKLNINCSHIINPDNLMVTVDADLIDQVMINLMLNAIDAVKETEYPMIKVTAGSNSKGRVFIDIADNGHGIKPDIMDKIFMPFFTSKKEGSGIGLSLSRQIMYLHKGTITVRSKPGEGAVFTLTF